MKKVKLTIIVLVVASVIALIVQNTEPVQTRFLIVEATMPRAALLAVTLLTGFVLGMCLKSRIVSGWSALAARDAAKLKRNGSADGAAKQAPTKGTAEQPIDFVRATGDIS